MLDADLCGVCNQKIKMYQTVSMTNEFANIAQFYLIETDYSHTELPKINENK